MKPLGNSLRRSFSWNAWVYSLNTIIDSLQRHIWFSLQASPENSFLSSTKGSLMESIGK